jgi:hypothetical protein
VLLHYLVRILQRLRGWCLAEETNYFPQMLSAEAAQCSSKVCKEEVVNGGYSESTEIECCCNVCPLSCKVGDDDAEPKETSVFHKCCLTKRLKHCSSKVCKEEVVHGGYSEGTERVNLLHCLLRILLRLSEADAEPKKP